MSVFGQLEEELETTVTMIQFEFEQLKADSRTKDYRKYLKKLRNIQGQMERL